MIKRLPKIHSREWKKARNDEIRSLRRQRYEIKDIAKKFKISYQRVSAICRGVVQKGL